MSKQTYDASVKDLVELAPQDWLILAGRKPAPVRLIDADLSSVSRAADKVLLVEDVETYLFHLEFQSGHDSATLPAKLSLRNGLLEARHELPVRTVVVLLRPAADSRSLSEIYQRGLAGEEPYRVFRYDVVRVWTLNPDELLVGGWGTLPLAPVAGRSDSEVAKTMARLIERLERPEGLKLANGIMANTLALLELRYTAEEVQMLLKEILNVEGSKTYRSILEEGLQKGMEQGLQQGMEAGKEQGRIKQNQEILLRLGEARFGAADGKTRKKIEGTTDLQRLEALTLRLLNVNGWKELLAAEPTSAKSASTKKPSSRKRKGS